MTALSYKYDVAFSFVAQDESLTEINDLLQDRLKTFLSPAVRRDSGHRRRTNV